MANAKYAAAAKPNPNLMVGRLITISSDGILNEGLVLGLDASND
jgi:hypothetical protein